jgi:hypothetical protein
VGQNLPSQDFCGTAALPPETGHRSARLARQKSANNGRERVQQWMHQKGQLFDHLVGAGEQRRRHG